MKTLKIESIGNGPELTVFVTGSIDSVTSPELEKELKSLLSEEVTEMNVDFSHVVFISSAGIRVMLWAHKQLGGRGKLVLKNVNADLHEIFEMTGLDGILNFA